jgi:arginine exporter protein ArgO
VDTGANPDSTLTGDKGLIKKGTNALIFVAGAIAVVVIIIGGIGYIASTGDPGRITKAKNTILYAVIGLIIAILAYAIVNYVVGAVS